MNRREFIGFAAVALGAAVVAPKLLLDCTLPPPGWRCSRGAGHGGPCAATETVEFQPRRSYKVGDVVTVSGFSDHSNNGTWVVVKDSTFARMA